jgi:hypothetical protein
MGMKLNRIFDALLPVRAAPDQLVYSVARIARFHHAGANYPGMALHALG